MLTRQNELAPKKPRRETKCKMYTEPMQARRTLPLRTAYKKQNMKALKKIARRIGEARMTEAPQSTAYPGYS